MTDKKPPTVSAETQNQSLGLVFDWQDWLPYLDDADASDDQKREMIKTLWQIVVAFVDLGFGLNPHQQAQSDDGQQSYGQTLDLKSVLEEAVLKSELNSGVLKHLNKPKP